MTRKVKKRSWQKAIESNDLAVTSKGEIYVSDPNNKQVWFVNRKGEKRIVDTGITKPNGVALSPDQSLLLVADTAGQFVYSFQIQPDGSLAYKQPYFHLHLADGATQSEADGMTVDTEGSLTRPHKWVCRSAIKQEESAGSSPSHSGPALQCGLWRAEPG